MESPQLFVVRRKRGLVMVSPLERPKELIAE